MNPDSEYQAAIKTRRLVWGVVAGAALMAVSAVVYGLLLMPEMPVGQEDTLIVNPEETVLFYQPEECSELEPLADNPPELDYLNLTRYLA